MRTPGWPTLPAAAFAAVIFVAASGTTYAAPPAPCDMRLDVVLTPDVPDASNPGFLSSLLSNHPGYRLLLLRQAPGSGVVLDLSGPGPEYRCENVIETIRRDARVLSVSAEQGASDDNQPVAVVSAPSPQEEQSNVHLSLAGLGSLIWAARNPAQAWKVVVPVEPDGVAYADIRARCVASTNASSSEAACP